MSRFTPKQNLALLRLLITGETPLQSRMSPELNPNERKALVEAGLLELRPSSSGRGKVVCVTDKAWEWAGGNLSAPLAERSPAGTPALHQLLVKLEGFLRREGRVLADLFIEPYDADLETRVRAAYLRAAGNREGTYVHLKHLRAEMGDTRWEAVNAVLVAMARSGRAELSHVNDPLSLDDEDRRATLSVAGFEKHLVLIKP